MPVITEEEEPNGFPVAADFPNFVQGGIDGTTATFGGPSTARADCGTSIEPLVGLEEPDYAQFERWIPTFIRPERPCDYCRSKNLDCYMRTGDASCKPCTSLFRECSLTNSNTLEASNYLNDTNGAYFDTLHPVDENTCRETGGFTGVRPLNSKTRASGTSTPIGPDDAPGSSKRNGIRFPRQAVKVLRAWLDSHQDHPYPTEEEKAQLERETELKPSQIANWLANARRRRKVTSAKPKPIMSPSLRPSTPAVDIPEPDKPWQELNPFERWKNSPPENEPAAFTDIANAIASSDLPDEATSPSSYNTRRHKGSSNGSSNVRPPSITSLETSHESSSAQSSAVLSRGSSGSFGSFNSSLAGKKERRRRRRQGNLPIRQMSDDKKRMFQCTFCTDTFKSKYDWTRHEKSLHLSLEKWICAPLGPIITDPVSGERVCVYCETHSPTDEHVESHNHTACEDKGLDARTFFRKDHLRQHLRLMHGCELRPNMDAWKVAAIRINSRCGFCAQRFTVWQERVDHLTAHFRAGKRMIDWRGCRGLDPAVAAQVTNAIPPYLIGMESVSPNPYSASNAISSSNKCTGHSGWSDGICGVANPEDGSGATSTGDTYSKATCWEILTVRLGRYANEMVAKDIVLTDELLQAHARRILFDNDDEWNQTAADNPEWLDLFKKAHGLNYIPQQIGGMGAEIPDDLEYYGDLGLRIPFVIQLKQYNQQQAQVYAADGKRKDDPGPGGDLAQRKTDLRKMYQILCQEGTASPPASPEQLEKRKAELRSMYLELCRERVFHAGGRRCVHDECAKNVIDVTFLESNPLQKSMIKHWCTYELSPEKAAIFASITAPNAGDKSSASEPEVEAARARARSLQHLQHNEIGCCPFREEIVRLGEQRDRQNAAQARAQSLMALGSSDRHGPRDACLGHGTQYQGTCDWGLPRHKTELPPDRAKNYATVTGAWADSGLMPEPISTSQLGIQQAATTSGAMMEFLSGGLGDGLPFSTDIATCPIPLSGISDANSAQIPAEWFAGTDFYADESVLQRDLDALIEASMSGYTAPTSATAPITSNGPLPSAPALPEIDWSIGDTMISDPMATTDMAFDTTMGDADMEELNFDSVFDMSTWDDGLGGV